MTQAKWGGGGGVSPEMDFKVSLGRVLGKGEP